MEVLAIEDRFVKGWPEHEDERAGLLGLESILTEEFDTDVHFTAYSCRVARRHTNGSIPHAEEAGVEMVAAVFDVDGPGHERTPEWWAEEEPKWNALGAKHGGFLYWTRGGYRIVFRLPEPVPIRSAEDADAWTARYLAWLTYLRRAFGIVADETCKTWTRLFRAPHTMREGEMQRLETFGDQPNDIGIWKPELEEGDWSPTYTQTDTPRTHREPGPQTFAPVAALLGAVWPEEGRHRAQMALAGALRRDGWSKERALEFLCEVCRAAGNEDRPKRTQTIEHTWSTSANLTGWPELSRHIGERWAKRAREMLDPNAEASEQLLALTQKDKSEAPAPSGFVWVPASELAKPLPPVEYVVKHFGIARGRPALLAGYGGLGKTMVAQALALHLAAGRTDCWGLEIRPGKVGHFDYEMTREPLQRRYQRLAEGHDINLASCDLHLCSMPSIYLSDERAEDELCRATEGMVFALLDNLAAAVATAQTGENEAGIRRYLDRLTRVTSKTGCAFNVLAHERKGGKGDEGASPLQRVRGSSAITDACGSVVSITAAKGTGYLTLEQNKASLRRQGDEVVLAVKDVSGTLPARPGDDAGIVIERVNSTERDKEETRRRDQEEQRAVDEFKPLLLEQIAKATGVGLGKEALKKLVGGNATRKLRALEELIRDDVLYEFQHLGVKTVQKR